MCSFLVCWLFVCWLPGPRHPSTVNKGPKGNWISTSTSAHPEIHEYIYITIESIHTGNEPTCSNYYFQHGFKIATCLNKTNHLTYDRLKSSFIWNGIQIHNHQTGKPERQQANTTTNKTTNREPIAITTCRPLKTNKTYKKSTSA